MIKKLIKNLNYSFQELIITSLIILTIILIAFNQSKFKSTNE
ncbi:MAG: hypothetical protein ACI914_000504, partial [Candidatus Marivariicella framensis]